MKLIITIPAFNEEKKIKSVIKEIPREIAGISEVKILVVDDGSTDDTAKSALRAGADWVIRNKSNKGLALTFRRSQMEALRRGADIIVNTDADFQYNQTEIPKLIQPILDGKADLVLGNRQVGKLNHMPRGNKYGNMLGSWLIRKITNSDIIDASTGFRAFTRHTALELNITSFHTYTHETLIQAVDKRLTIIEVPVEFRKREGKSRLIANLRSHIFKAMVTILKTFTVYKPLRVMLPMGGVLFLVGLIFVLRFLGFYLFTKDGGSGHVQSLIIAAVFMMIGFQTFVLALIASAVGVSRKLIEDVLYYIKKDDFGSEK